MGERQAHNSHGGRFAEDLLCKSPGYNNGNSPLFHWLQVVIDTGLLHSRPLIGKPPSMILVDVQVTGTCLCIRLVPSPIMVLSGELGWDTHHSLPVYDDDSIKSSAGLCMFSVCQSI